ncbi:MAG: very-short-patch-repair endonuclease [Alteromonadaceae bacterium]|jgi:very-short-patch-repair endonuclease
MKKKGDTMGNFNINAEIAKVYSFAFQQNQYPLITSLELNSSKAALPDNTNKNHSNLKLVLTSDPEVFFTEEWHIDSLESGHTFLLQKRPVKISNEYLEGLTESIEINLNFTLYIADEVIENQSYQTNLLPKNFWGGEERMAELLAAFSTPNANYITELVKKTSDVMKAAGHGSSLDGYQSKTRERPYLMAAALWNVISNETIAYVNPPTSFAYSGQRIRLPNDIKTHKTGACLDLSLLFSGCLEHIGLNPIVAITDSHACCGFWLIDECFPLLTNDDSMDIRKRVASKDFVLFETTLAASDSAITFGQAIEYADQIISEESEDKFVYAIDLAQARKRQIRPIPTIGEKTPAVMANNPNTAIQALPIAPPLPPVRKEELPVVDTPDGRVEQWQRKLLDLTKRNRLLNLSKTAVAIKLFCPDIALLEDELASNQSFNFIAAGDTPNANEARDKELFKFKFGNDLQTEFAKDQLKSNTLIANDSSKKLEKNLLSLYRKSKTDLEEGGSNTLFIAVGMLKWKETPESERIHQAPLILLPAELKRSSARSKIKIKQRDGDDPIFNATLIEFLQNDYEIDLSQFNESLPTDESGIDVDLILSVVRDKIKDVKGFEVVEELVLSTFSFAKYLMWKDLKDRVNDLKLNHFVEHLVQNPQKTYEQNVQFKDQDDIDNTLKPSSVFAPLNADSSQLVAIDASTKAQDFVLEGPPGTGKSETIANIICHNLANGKKVLFVAEKMAALNVVYSRLQKIGLDHLCLELHSNKANKRSILEQLKKAWTTRETASVSEWNENADKLFNIRKSLNAYVNELHQESLLGITPRQAISRYIRYKDITKVDLGWGNSFKNSPLASKEELDDLYETAKKLGLAFSDIKNLNLSDIAIIQNTNWSNSWQTELIATIKKVKNSTLGLKKDFRELVEQLQLAELNEYFDNYTEINLLVTCLTEQKDTQLNFIYKPNARDELAKLNLLAEFKAVFNEQVQSSKLTFSVDEISSHPTSDWLRLFQIAQQKFGPLKWLAKRKIIKTLGEVGVHGEITFEELSLLNEINSTAKKVSENISTFEQDKIWQGWSTSGDYLSSKYQESKRLFDITRKVAGRLSTPSLLINNLKEKVIDNFEFYQSSTFAKACNHYSKSYSVFKNDIDTFIALGGDVPADKTITELTHSCDEVIALEPKINAWCNWLEAKKAASAKGLHSVITCLEGREIESEDAVHQTKNAVCAWLAPILIDASDTLRTFRTSKHENLIEEFRDLDELVANTTAEYISSIVASGTPDPNSPQSPAEYGVLSREFNKKSNHKPIRQLINEMGENLLHLTPCFMMSPLSVSQFLPAHFNAFDLVVFDEASQITVWDAVGAIARGKNVIIVGDPKQMPPTNFFSKSGSDDLTDEADLESILDQALSARLPHHRLTGHYRSRHESLIAFSNSHYYENSLVTFPCAETKESAVSLHKIKGLYSKGKERNNIMEANAVADYIVQRLSDKRKKYTIGVVTLNSEQQRCIEDCLDDRRRKHPHLEPFFQGNKSYDPIFVKNLESVQGDERDIIVLSLGYGPVEPLAKTMSMNFGPLNKQGGERRLNVAITRATTEIHVFASFDYTMIDLSRTSALAVKHLKYFLEYAEKGPIALPETAEANYGVDQFDSYFEESVAFALREKGWIVQTQIGVSKFRIDLGVIHPNKPGQFLAGIECDGATYHGSPAARDRDRVRHIILENLGWKLLRIWSTDYFIDENSIIERIHNQLNRLLDLDLVQEDELEDETQFEPEEVEEENRLTNINPDKYFHDDYKKALETMAKEILHEKNAISLQELTSDIGWKHNLARTTKKQLDHIELIISPWAGIVLHKSGEKTVWKSTNDIKDLVSWRGVNAFGIPREWNTIAYPERLGLAQKALEKSPNDPVDYIFKTFSLNRRTKSTTKKFETWVNEYHSRELT